MIEKIINIVVKEVGIDSAEKSVDSLSNSLNNLEGESEGLTNSMATNSQSILDNGGAMGILNDITGGYAMTVKDAVEASALFTKESKIGQLAIKAYTWATTAATGATRALKIALISTGIGAIVVGIIALVVAVKNYTDGAEDAKKAQEDFNDALEETNRLSKQRIEDIQFQLSLERERLREMGASIEEQRNAERKASADRISSLKDEISQLESLKISQDLSEEDRLKAIEDRSTRIIEAGNKVYEEYKANRLREAQFRADDAEKEREEDKKNAEKSLEQQKKLAEERKKLREEELERQKQLQRDMQDFIFNMNQSAYNLEYEQYAQKEALLASLREQSREQQLETEYENGRRLLTNQAEVLELELAFEEKRNQLRKEKREEDLANERAVEEAKREVQAQTLDAISGFIGLAGQLGEKNKALQKATVIAENAAGIARIIINTGAANAKAVAASPLTLGQPFVTLNTISAGLSIAGSIVATTKALSQLGGGSAGSAPRIGNSGGNASESQAPQFNIVGQNSNNQLANSIANQQNQPIETYVVGNSVTTQQALDRNRINTAMFN